MNLRHIFFPVDPATAHQTQRSRHLIIAEGAVAAIIYAAGTGNLFTGYLTQLGASVSFCAMVAMIPQLGCILQFISPYFFERLRHRKLAIWVCCVLYRFALAFSLMAAQIAPVQPLGLVVALYFIAFMAAGAVTPALQHLVLSVAPTRQRGAYFARKDIFASCINSLAMLLLGRQLDAFAASGNPMLGYTVIAAAALVLAAVDAVLLAAVSEPPSPMVQGMRLKDLMRPLTDRDFRPMVRYWVLSGLFGGLSTSFLTVYLLRGLGLSHTFITSANVAAAVAAIAGSWAWGRYADKVGWRAVVLRASLVGLLCTLGWGLLPAGLSTIGAPLLLIIAAACTSGSGIAGINLQYACCPAEYKTTYIGVTAAVSSLAAVLAAAIGAFVQPMLQASLGMGSIAVLFLVSALGGLANLLINARKLPNRI